MSVPIRQDVYVYNEATSFSLTSAEAVSGISDEDWHVGRRLAKEHRAVLLELVSDNSLNVRLLVNDELEEDEQREWVAKISTRLIVPDGKLLISGGCDPRCFDAWNEEGSKDNEDEGIRLLEIPPGEYLANIFTLFTSENCLSHYAENDATEPLGQWFRTSYPGEAFPAWLLMCCEDYEGQDPGYNVLYEDIGAALKASKLALAPGRGAYLDFIVQLLAAQGNEPINEAKDEYRWLETMQGARSLSICPRGLQSTTIMAEDDPAELWQ